MLSYISINWKDRPLELYEAIINLISNTTTKKGLKVSAKIDKKEYETGKKVPDRIFKSLNLKNHAKLKSWLKRTSKTSL